MTLIKSKTLRGYLQGISGLFITPDNPQGLTPKELDILTVLVFSLNEKGETILTTDVRARAGELTNHSKQVITNYIKRLRDKKAITAYNTLHPILRGINVTISYESPDNV